MEREQHGPHGDDDFLERIRRAAARTPAEQKAAPNRMGTAPEEASDTSPSTAGTPLVSSRTADALRDLEARIAGLEQQVRQLNDDRARVVADVADAVVARLDARWARSVGGGDSSV